MASLTGYNKVFASDTTAVDSTLEHPLGTRAFDTAGNEYIYLTGVTSTAVGSWVTFDEDHLTALAAANASGRVAIAMAITDSISEYGWYMIYGKHPAAKVLVGFADNGVCYLTTTAGSVDDADVAGDLINGAIGRSAGTGTPATASAAIIELNYPHVNDTAND